MTFLWIDNQGLPPRHLGERRFERRFERRVDERTASDISDALRARGIQAAALAMDHLHVDMDLALRVLAGPRKRRVMHEAVQAAYGNRRAASANGPFPAGMAPEMAA